MVLFRKQGVVRSSFVSERMVLLVQEEKKHSEEGLLRSLLPAASFCCSLAFCCSKLQKLHLCVSNSTSGAVPNPLLRSVVRFSPQETLFVQEEEGTVQEETQSRNSKLTSNN